MIFQTRIQRICALSQPYFTDNLITTEMLVIKTSIPTGWRQGQISDHAHTVRAAQAQNTQSAHWHDYVPTVFFPL